MGCASGKENAAAPDVLPKARGSSIGSPKVDCDLASTISPQGSDMDISNLSSISFESAEGSPRLEVKGGKSLVEAVSKLQLRIEESGNTKATAEELQQVKQSIVQQYMLHEKERKHGADRQRAVTSKHVGAEERNMKKSKQTFKKGEN